MSTGSVGTPSGATSTLPPPLSPGDFPDPTAGDPTTPTTGGPTTTTPGGATFTDSDRATLQTARDLLGAARADLSSGDTKRAASGKRQIEVLTNYLTGFFDSRGLIEAAPVKPGFETLFGADVRPDLGTALDEFVAALDLMLSTVDTRSWHSFWNGVADGCIAVGAALLVA